MKSHFAFLRIFTLVLVVIGIAGIAGIAAAAECIVPARPKGGFELTCKLLQSGLPLVSPATDAVSIVGMPGGVGAIGFNTIITRRSAEPDTLVAFSGGSLLNIARGKFGKYTERDVRWLAAIGIDYGVLVVRSDSPFTSVNDVMKAFRQSPQDLVFGGSGTVGGQDWTKLAMLTHDIKTDGKAMRFVGFEGGGDALGALLGKYVDVVSGDMSEAIGLMRNGMPLRILAVFSRSRLPGMLADVPTAREQGYDIEWPNVRGFYMGAHVPDKEYQRWVAVMEKLLSHPEFSRMREEAGLQAYAKTGGKLNDEITRLIGVYRCIAPESAGVAVRAGCVRPPK